MNFKSPFFILFVFFVCENLLVASNRFPENPDDDDRSALQMLKGGRGDERTEIVDVVAALAGLNFEGKGSQGAHNDGKGPQSCISLKLAPWGRYLVKGSQPTEEESKKK